MVKVIAAITIFALAWVASRKTYRWAKQRQSDLLPLSWACLAAMATMLIGELIILLLHAIGWYPD